MGEKIYLISEAAKLVGVESHVLRYWEEELELDIGRTEQGHRYYTEENIHMGVRTFSWTGYAARPRFCRYSQGLIFPSDVLILFVLYHSKYSLKMSINSDILTPVQS